MVIKRRSLIGYLTHELGFPGGSVVRNPPLMQETWTQSLGQENPLEKELASHSSVLAWRISMNRGAWWATVYRVTRSWTGLQCVQTTYIFNKYSKDIQIV